MNAIIRRAHRFIRNTRRRAASDESGVTLVELMIASAILSIAVLGLIGAFGGIQKAMQISKNKTLASNLVQEKMQILTQKNYYEVLVTPSPSFYAVNGSTNIPYDTTYFPPETILEGGITYTRLTYVQVAEEDSGAIVVLSPSTPDTGMHLLTISVVWKENGTNRMSSVSSVLANPNTVMSSSYFWGRMTDSVSGLPIVGGVVNIAENMGWRDTTDAAGKYHINVNLGSYNIVASAQGYFPSFLLISIGQNVPVQHDFPLQPMSSGTATGIAWVNPNVIVSQVVASTVQAGENNFIAQYIELYNPTPNTVTINGGLVPLIRVNYPNPPGCGDGTACTDPTYGIKLNYNVNTIAPFGYYIIANTGTFMLNGVNVTADAVFADNANTFCTTQPSGWNTGANPPVKTILNIGHVGDVWLTNAAGVKLDSVGWMHNALSHPNCNPYCIPLPAAGFVDGEQFVRTSSPNFASNVWGRAYDANISSIDFVYPPIIAGFPYQPFNSLSSTQTPVAGVPAAGAVVTGSDPLSNSTTAYLVGYPPVANFLLPSVATATSAAPWTILITSGLYTLENDTVTIAASGSNYNFPSSTTILNQAAVNSFVDGSVTDVFGGSISGPNIQVTGGGGHAWVVNGRYLMTVTPGSVDITANASPGNSSYVSISSLAVTAVVGQIHDGVNFVLSQGGRISGFVTRDGINALPGVTMTAFDSNGLARDSEVSDTSGRFTTINIATGTYTMQPELDSLELSNPLATTVIIGSGQTVFSTTFTISGALGTISGTVKLGGAPISTGVLVVITTSTYAGSPPAPPALSSNTLASGAIYLTSSLEDGSYSVSVRQSTSPTYNAYGYYSILSSTGGVTFQSQKLTGISVLAGSSVTGNNFAW